MITTKRILLLLFVSTLLFSIIGCSASEREYHEDIVIALQDPSEKIIIREWQYLLGSGADVYYQKGNADAVLLGKTTGADDGFCPFKEGLYELIQNGDEITVKWCFSPSDSKDIWRYRSFNIPTSNN